MDFTNAIAIIITGPFVLAMTHGVAHPLQSIVAIILIGVESGFRYVSVIRVAATLYAVPYYSKLGYKKSTDVRTSWSFNGYGLPIQPMKKMLEKDFSF